MSRASRSVTELEAQVGKTLGISAWRRISQDMVDQFASLTDDHQFIHVDPRRAAGESPFGGTIAHGFLTLSFLSAFSEEAAPIIEGTRHALNYGFDRIRFLSPVRTGERVRGHFTLESLSWRSEQAVLMQLGVSVEIEGAERPALIAQWLTLAELNFRRSPL